MLIFHLCFWIYPSIISLKSNPFGRYCKKRPSPASWELETIQMFPKMLCCFTLGSPTHAVQYQPEENGVPNRWAHWLCRNTLIMRLLKKLIHLLNFSRELFCIFFHYTIYSLILRGLYSYRAWPLPRISIRKPRFSVMKTNGRRAITR